MSEWDLIRIAGIVALSAIGAWQTLRVKALRWAMDRERRAFVELSVKVVKLRWLVHRSIDTSNPDPAEARRMHDKVDAWVDEPAALCEELK